MDTYTGPAQEWVPEHSGMDGGGTQGNLPFSVELLPTDSQKGKLLSSTVYPLMMQSCPNSNAQFQSSCHTDGPG